MTQQIIRCIFIYQSMLQRQSSCSRNVEGGNLGFRDFTKNQCGIRDLDVPGKRDSPKLGTVHGKAI